MTPNIYREWKDNFIQQFEEMNKKENVLAKAISKLVTCTHIPYSLRGICTPPRI